MKRIVVATMLVLVAASLSGCKTIPENTDVEQAVMDAQHRWEEAFSQFDPESMQSLLAEDDLQTDFRGVVQGKASWLQDFKTATANVRSGVSKYEISFDDEKVRLYGNTAIVTGRITVNGQRKGTSVNRVVRFTMVWVKRSGVWQLVSYQATPIEPR